MASAAASAPFKAARSLRVASWNLAAVNNNPFEYWITHDDPAYIKMMASVERFVKTNGGGPDEGDVAVSTVFDEGMCAELLVLMERRGWTGVSETRSAWETDFRGRRIVSGFLKDPVLGEKRLTSMPDRTTNTLYTPSGPAYRPTVINCFAGAMGSRAEWWSSWKRFMFEDASIVLEGRSAPCCGADLLQPIRRSKYPALTEAEERMSLPLQTLCMAIFDAVQLHVVETCAPGEWERLRREIADALTQKKVDRTLDVIEDAAFADVDVWFLQEAQLSFAEAAVSRPGIAARYTVVVPARTSRANQNSMALLSRARFSASSVAEVTDLATARLGERAPVSDGDLLLFTATERDVSATNPGAASVSQAKRAGETFLLCSFHGDTNGLATLPVVTAVSAVQSDLVAGSVNQGPLPLVCGLDANVYDDARPSFRPDKQQGCAGFGEAVASLGLSTAGPGGRPDPSFKTCMIARTFLQPQLSKAMARDEATEKGDFNPKDHFLFSPGRFPAVEGGAMKRVNTARGGSFDASIELLPTLEFPSDHCLITATLLGSAFKGKGGKGRAVPARM
jgi:hypothetical protein